MKGSNRNKDHSTEGEGAGKRPKRKCLQWHPLLAKKLLDFSEEEEEDEEEEDIDKVSLSLTIKVSGTNHFLENMKLLYFLEFLNLTFLAPSNNLEEKESFSRNSVASQFVIQNF